MARASKTSSRKKPLALELLENDHRTVEALFEQYESQKEAEDDAREETAKRICGELTVHAQLEEELFYPWLRENLDEDDMEMVEEAYVEHASAKDLIAQIESADGTDAECDAKVKVLSEYIKHHVKEEENEIFTAVSDKGEELDALGQDMYARKAELAEEMGLMQPEGEEPAMAANRKSSRGQAAQRGSR
jgi:hemerythrin superfamily protein